MPDINSVIAQWRPVVDTAARNAWSLYFGDGVETSTPTPSVLVNAGPHRDLYRFGSRWTPRKNPVLLIPPLAVSAHCYDLRPGQSLAAHLLGGNHTPYVVDYGTMGYADRAMGFEAWVDDILPEAIRVVSAQHGGADVSVIGWSLGGTMSLLTSAAHPELPIASIATIGTPVDYTKIPAISPLRLIGRFTGDAPLTSLTTLVGGLPASLVQASYKVTALQREVLKPWFVARNLLDTETLARMESVDKFMNAMPGYPAKAFQQICAQLMLGNALHTDSIELAGRRISLSAIDVPVLAIGGTSDVIAPMASAEAIESVLTGSPAVRFEKAPGSHLGLLAGPTAENTTWAFIDDFLAQTAAQPAIERPMNAMV